jgi:hypothetical protein
MLSSDQCWTFIQVIGQVNTKWATVYLWGRGDCQTLI